MYLKDMRSALFVMPYNIKKVFSYFLDVTKEKRMIIFRYQHISSVCSSSRFDPVHDPVRQLGSAIDWACAILVWINFWSRSLLKKS